MGTKARKANSLADSTLRKYKWTGRDEWFSDGGSRGAGRLVAKGSQAGVTFYFAYFNSDDKRRFLPLGRYDASGERGLTLLQARDKTAAYSSLYRAGDTEIHERLEHEQEQEILARRAAKEAAERAERTAKASTLRQLLDGYQKHLERGKKQSAADVRRIFAAHVYEPWPDLANKRAADVTVEEFVALLARLTDAGKGRTAGKLRSYLRAAYALAISAKTDPDAPISLRTFGIVANPVASIGALSKYNLTRDRVLSVEEMKHYIGRVRAMPEGPRKDALLLCVLLGGQRITQLLRVRPVDVDLTARTVTLFDGKGRRKQPRAHVLPLHAEAKAIFERRLAAFPDAAYAFSSDGETQLSPSNVSAESAAICRDMLASKEAKEHFELRDIRRTCETMLAAKGVSSDIRGQVQSHGLGGVQKRHYDRHEYMAEKNKVLSMWERRLRKIETGEQSTVIEGKFGTKGAAS